MNRLGLFVPLASICQAVQTVPEQDKAADLQRVAHTLLAHAQGEPLSLYNRAMAEKLVDQMGSIDGKARAVLSDVLDTVYARAARCQAIRPGDVVEVRSKKDAEVEAEASPVVDVTVEAVFGQERVFLRTAAGGRQMFDSDNHAFILHRTGR